MRIINLVENTEGESGCGVEHGLCFYIETEKHKLLMDTGQTDLLLENAQKLGIDLTAAMVITITEAVFCHLCRSIRMRRFMFRRQPSGNIIL